MDMQVIINQMIVLFILMTVGFIVGKAKMLTREGNRTLSKIVLFIAMPSLILSSVFENEMDITFGDTFFFLLMSLATLLLAFLIAVPVINILGGEKANRGLLNFMSVFSNCGFMGFPVVISIFGISSAYYVALFNIPFNALIFSLGIFLVSGKKAYESGVPEEQGDNNDPAPGFNPKLLLNPTLIIALIAIPIALLGIRPPQVITEAVRITGSITTPGAMLVIGSTLAYIPLKSVFSEWRILPVTLLKLIVIPIVSWLILRQIITNELMLGVLVVVSAMPTAAMASMFAIEYNGNERVASAGVFLTTLLCGVTIPLIVYLFLM